MRGVGISRRGARIGERGSRAGAGPRLRDLAHWFVLLAVLDLGMTLVVLGIGGHEANPVARLVLERLGPWGMAGLKVLSVATVLLAVRQTAAAAPRVAARVLRAASTATAAAVAVGMWLTATFAWAENDLEAWSVTLLGYERGTAGVYEVELNLWAGELRRAKAARVAALGTVGPDLPPEAFALVDEL